MKDGAREVTEESVLILAPTGRDAELSCRFLQEAGLDARACGNMQDLVTLAESNCGSLVLAEESLGVASLKLLTLFLAKQPSWSEIPVAIITSGGEASGETLRRLTQFTPVGNVTILERPFRPRTFVSLLQVALRSRRRQYQVRDLLAERSALARRFRLMAEGMPQKIFTAGPDGQIDFYNEQWLNFAGVSALEMMEKTWLFFVHPDDLRETRRRWERALETGKLFEVEHRLRRQDGAYSWHLSRASPVADENGRIHLFIVSHTDVDGQKNAATRLEALVAERTASLVETNGQLEAFCYTIAHDLRAPLRAQRSFSIALLEEYGEVIGETGSDYARRIHQAAERLDKLVSDLLMYSRISRTELQLAPLPLEPAVRAVLESMRFEIEATRAEVDVRNLGYRVTAHETTLGLIITNLVSNALKFVEAGSVPKIRISAEERGEHIRLTVADSGIGIAGEYQPQIFGVFNRLHKTGEYPGTGVGLAIVQKGVERLRGRLGVESAKGEGSQFWIELARA